MAEIEKKPVKVVETILRDAHQSLIATRMSTEQMLPIIEKLDKVGYYAVECWGGATFDASLRFLKEDPWERLRKLRDGFKNTKLQMLFRGQNILGYRPYADDVVEYFVQKSAANGIDIIRIFDCMNDLRNLQTAVKAANKEKAHAQVAMAYTLGDAYTLDYWTDLAKRIEDMGADSICIKDMAGLLVPYKATELVQALKETVKIPIDLHSHYTSGARNAQEAVRIARLSRELGCGDFVKIEVIHDSKYLLPDNYETIKATEILAKEGFVVMPYMYPDLNAARDLVNAGAACVMPLGSPIGSNKGICTKEFIQILIDEIDLPIIVDAGIGRPSQACEAMEMGAAAVMANTAIATAGDVRVMAEAFKKAIEAGRSAYLSGMGRTLERGASASSPLTGFLHE